MATVTDKADSKRLLGSNIRLACRRTGISEYRLAARLEVRPSQVSEWVNAKHRPEDATLVRIGEICGNLPLSWFYEEHEDGE